jgi:outer membrane exchange protein TraA
LHPLLSRHVSSALMLVLLCLSGSAGAAKLPDVVVTGDPVAPSPAQPGTGLCVASSVSTDPANDFPQSTSSFIGGMNDFMERKAASRVTSVLRTPLDLSNNNAGGTQTSRGDFVDAIPGCSSYGCGFFVNDATTSFGSRLRGYLNVTPDMVSKPLHFGFFADDAVSLTIFDRNTVPYQIINRPPQLGAPAWRTTNTVTFQQAGLYPIEVLYAEVTDQAALELALLDGTFTDFERTANQTPVISLSSSGFVLVPAEKFFQAETGRPSSPSLDQCQQCNRANANAPGNGGCGLNSGQYCNSAALCASCDTPRFCGPSCSPCGQSTPLCINFNGTYTCVECDSDTQCPNGRCDPATHACKGCSDNAECPSGKVCNLSNSTCVECNADSQCPGGKVCDLSTFTCVQCTSDGQCPNERCDSATHTCKGCNADLQCSGGKLCNLPTSTCVECNASSQCSTGRVCNVPTFTCVECNGASQCSGGRVCNLPTFTCVECNADGQCPNGRVCNLSTFACVECNADTQCSNGRCDPATHTCQGCNDNSDCSSGQVCDLTQYACVECTRNEDCSPGQLCVPELKQCRVCPSGSSCENGEPTPEPPGKGCGCGASDTTGGASLLILLTGSVLFRSLRRGRRTFAQSSSARWRKASASNAGLARATR